MKARTKYACRDHIVFTVDALALWIGQDPQIVMTPLQCCVSPYSIDWYISLLSDSIYSRFFPLLYASHPSDAISYYKKVKFLQICFYCQLYMNNWTGHFCFAIPYPRAIQTAFSPKKIVRPQHLRLHCQDTTSRGGLSIGQQHTLQMSSLGDPLQSIYGRSPCRIERFFVK